MVSSEFESRFSKGKESSKMAANFSYVGTGAGIIKIFHILFGVITVGCISASFEKEETRDKFFLGVVITVFLVSIIYFILHLVSSGIARSGINRLVDSFYHFVGAALLIVAASLFLQSSVRQNNETCKNYPPGYDTNDDLCGPFATKATAGAFALINGILYLVAIALTAVGSSADDEPEIEGYQK